MQSVVRLAKVIFKWSLDPDGPYAEVHYGKGFSAGNKLRWFASTQIGFGDIAGARKTVQLAYTATQVHDSPGIDYPRKGGVSTLASTGDVDLSWQGPLDIKAADLYKQAHAYGSGLAAF